MYREYRRIKIGDFTISVRSKEKLSALGIDEKCRFLSDIFPGFILEINYDEVPQVIGEKVFDSEGAWALYKSPQRYILRLPGPPGKISRLLLLNSNLNRGKLYIQRYHGLRTPLPLEHPLGQILLTLLLSQNGGATVHACGLENKGEGILFLGPSGSGKSTIAGLWARESEAVVLSDERIIVRKHNSLFYIYGTPWAGTAKMSSPRRAVLKKIFFIKPDRKNSLSPLKPSIALGKTMVLSYLPVWDKEKMERTINFFAGLVEAIPSYQLGFKPDKEMIKLVRSV